ncbi:MAG: GntR family transcriptional regulator [Opitutaceae bacterium]|nr:GntR family transcriptional regulator [Opitutaceae bacterium]
MASHIQSDQAYAEIHRRILVLEIRPEERLKEQEWAKRLGVGRVAVREALTRMLGEGLVTRGAKGGFYAARMSAGDVAEIREVREIIESAAIRLASKRLSDQQILELKTSCDEFAFLASKGYHTAACEADRRFHAILVAASGNSRLVRAYEHCHIPLFHIRIGQFQGYINDYDETEKEHRAIIAALERGEVETAVGLLRAHFNRGSDVVLSNSAKTRSG